jgi:16S rRNA (uracil1498-N3)-methyltransferase
MHGPVALSRWLAEPTELTGFVAWAKLRDRSNAPQTRTSPGARLLVGPEGGLTDDEAAAAIAAGLRPISLGPWTLRTETAVIAGLSRLVHREA